MENWILNPAVVFAVMLGLIFALNGLFARLAFRSGKAKPDCCKSYACGEKNFDSTLQPDYSQFFSFVFFFTLAHVATLIITTMPYMEPGAKALAILYITSGIIGLYILLRK